MKKSNVIKSRPIRLTGIQEAVMLGKEMKREKKSSLIADGILKAEMTKKVYGFGTM